MNKKNCKNRIKTINKAASIRKQNDSTKTFEIYSRITGNFKAQNKRTLKVITSRDLIWEITIKIHQVTDQISTVSNQNPLIQSKKMSLPCTVFNSNFAN